MRLLTLVGLCFAFAACNSAAVQDRPEPEKPDRRVQGEVLDVDASPMAYDGDAVIRVQTEAGEEVRVLIPARLNLCAAEGLGLYSELEPGDRVEVQGLGQEEASVRPCESESHYLRRL